MSQLRSPAEDAVSSLTKHTRSISLAELPKPAGSVASSSTSSSAAYQPRRFQPMFANAQRTATIRNYGKTLQALSKDEQEYQKDLASKTVPANLSLRDYVGYKKYKNTVSIVNQTFGADDASSKFSSGSKASSRKSLLSSSKLKTFDRAAANALSSLRTPLPPQPTLPAYDKLQYKHHQLDKDLDKRAIPHRQFRDKLEPEQAAVVQQLLRKDGVLSTMPGAEVTAKDMRKLKPSTWLNDEVINFYVIMINKRSKEAEEERNKKAKELANGDSAVAAAAPVAKAAKGGNKQTGKRASGKNNVDPTAGREILKVHGFTSFFFNKLKTSGYEGVRRWTKKVDVFACDAVLMPVNLHDAHWVTACINLRLKRFEFYDSMGHSNPFILRVRVPNQMLLVCF